MVNVAAAILVLALGAGCGRIGIDPVVGQDGGATGDDAATDDALVGDGNGDAAQSGWWDPAWQRRIKLTFNNPGPSLQAFPVMVRLASSRIDYSETQNMGQDLRFIAADGVSPLPHDIEHWNESGTSIVWTIVQQIGAASTTDHVWLYYNNPTAPSFNSPALVWGMYKLVWHLGENPAATAPQIRDSTLQANHGTTAGAMAAGQQVGGQAAGALVFDGSDDWITAPSDGDLELKGDLTISTWVMRNTTSRAEWICDYVTSVSETEANNHLYELAFDTGGRIEFLWEYGAGLDTGTESTTAVATGTATWMHITATRDAAANEVRFYENGAPLGTPVSYTNDPTGGGTSSLWVGGEDDSTSSKQPLAGRLDEFRIETWVRPPAWVAAQYRSMTDGMIGYGAAESF